LLINVLQCKIVILKEQFGAPGSHSDVSIQVRWAEPDILYPMSHVYVAVAIKVLFPSKPAVKYIDPFSGGARWPQSVGTRQNIYC